MSESDADWALKDADINAALGAEIRAARELALLTRPELVNQLPFKTTVASLLNWELGHRAISYARLVELARTLNRTAPDLLRQAIARVDSIQSLFVDLSPYWLSMDTDSRFDMLRVWATNKRAATSDKEAMVRVHHTVVREWAVQCGVSLSELVKHLESVASAVQVHFDRPQS